MSDLTTLAALTRVIARARDRVLNDRAQDPSVLQVLDLLLEELQEEMRYKPHGQR